MLKSALRFNEKERPSANTIGEWLLVLPQIDSIAASHPEAAMRALGKIAADLGL
ncbi:MAG: hypothetical protein MHM6MM_000967 [Cercozoa sp. M6MM]